MAHAGRRKPGVGTMPESLQRVARFLRDKIGWQGLGFVVCLVIIAFAFVVLYFQLRDIVFGEVLDALRNTSRQALLLAGLFVTAGYVILTFYDYFALRTIGRRDVPYRVAALAGFTSYAIGHNVGVSAFSGGAVRYRIYSSASGLSLIEVAKTSWPDVVAQRVEDRAGAAGGHVLGHLGPALIGCARRGDHLHDLVGHELRSGHDLVVGGRPGQHLADLVEQRRRARPRPS